MSKKSNTNGTPRRRSDAGAAERLMRKSVAEPDHARQVRNTSLRLFDVTRELHGLGVRERRMLQTAALLHDIGYRADPVRHHKVSRDLILDARLEGFDRNEQRMVACIARYHRKAHPKSSHKVYADLSRGDQQTVAKLAALLRIADGLDRCHDGGVRSVRFVLKGPVALLHVRQDKPNPTDILGGMRKKALFDEVFGLNLEILPESQ